MSRIERYQSEDGVAVELRYSAMVDGSEELDEIVAPSVHIEMLDLGVCWADVHGIRIIWSAMGRESLRFMAEADTAGKQGEAP